MADEPSVAPPQSGSSPSPSASPLGNSAKFNFFWAEKMTACFFLNLPLSSSSSTAFASHSNYQSPSSFPPLLTLISTQFSHLRTPRFSRQIRAASAAMEATQQGETTASASPMKLLFVEMGVGYDQHGQDVTSAAMRACRDAITSNSIPAFRRGSIPGVTFEQMKLEIKLGVPRVLQPSLDVEKVKSVFPYGEIVKVEVVDGGLICSSGVLVEEMGDKTDDCYIVNAAVYIGY